MAPLGSDATHALMLIAGGGVALYIACRSAVDASAAIPARGPVRRGRLALAQWMPIAVVAMGALVAGQPTLAVAAVLAASVACLTLVMGIIAFLQPVSGVIAGALEPGTRACDRAAAALLLPATLLVFLAGFKGQLTYLHAALLGGEGMLVLVLCWDRAPAVDGGDGHGDGGRAGDERGGRMAHPLIRCIQLLVAIALAAAGAWAAVHGAERAGHAGGIASPSLVATLLIGPLLLVPMLGIGSDLTARGQGSAAHASLSAVVLLNLCLLLPAMVVEAHLHPLQRLLGFAETRLRVAPPAVSVAAQAPATAPPATRPATTGPATTGPASTQPTTAPADADDSAEPVESFPLPFPPASWRVDAVILIVLALFLLPVAVGRWPLTRGAGIALILGYLAYLALEIAVSAIPF